MDKEKRLCDKCGSRLSCLRAWSSAEAGSLHFFCHSCGNRFKRPINREDKRDDRMERENK